MTAALYDVQLEHLEPGTDDTATLNASLGGYTIGDAGHSFSAVMRLEIQSGVPEQPGHVVRIIVGVIGQWISADVIDSPVDSSEAMDRLFPYAKAYAEGLLAQAQISLPPIPDIADVPFTDRDEATGDAVTEPQSATPDAGRSTRGKRTTRAAS